MKKLIKVLSLAFLLVGMQAMANPAIDYAAVSVMRIHVKSYAPVQVEINGVRYQTHRGFIDIAGLRPGLNEIVVLEEFINRRGYARVRVVDRQRLYVAPRSRIQAVVRINGRLDVVSVGRRAVNNRYMRPQYNYRGYDKQR